MQKLLKEVTIDQHVCCVNNHALHEMTVLPVAELMANDRDNLIIVTIVRLEKGRAHTDSSVTHVGLRVHVLAVVFLHEDLVSVESDHFAEVLDFFIKLWVALFHGLVLCEERHDQARVKVNDNILNNGCAKEKADEQMLTRELNYLHHQGCDW